MIGRPKSPPPDPKRPPKANTRTENSIEQSLVRWCKAQGYPCMKLRSPGRGWPDRCVLLPENKVAWIELKAPRGVLSPQQEFVRDRIIAPARHHFFVVRTLEEAQDAINTVLSGGTAG